MTVPIERCINVSCTLYSLHLGNQNLLSGVLVLTSCPLVIFHAFLSSADFIFKNQLF